MVAERKAWRGLIDLNADLGEGCGDDAAILTCVSSANIACGWHAGDAITMLASVRAALERGVAIGAHPGYPDREHFGRRVLHLSRDELRAGILYQLGALEAIVHGEGGRVVHVKPHGALYNQAARDATLADLIAAAVREHDPGLRLMGLAGSELVAAALRHGLSPIAEVFADRAYLSDGTLAPRGMPGAMIEDMERALAQTLSFVRGEPIATLDGGRLLLDAESICLHGDGAHALAFARRIREVLGENGVSVGAELL